MAGTAVRPTIWDFICMPMKNISSGALFYSIFLTLTILLAFSANPVASKGSEQTLFEKEVHSLLEKGDCAQAWKELWRLARKRDQQTLREIVLAIIPYRGLVPPSYFPLTENSLQGHLINNMIALELYNWRDPEIGAKLDKYGLSLTSNPQEIFVNTDAKSNYERVDSCLKSRRDKGYCVTLAVDLKIIPLFETYVAMMDRAPRDAFCLPLPAPKSITSSPDP